MATFLVTHAREAHRMVELEGDRHPPRVHEVIDGMAREFRLHAGALCRGERVYVPADLPDDVVDDWVARYFERVGDRSIPSL
jgi:hypothetical protein